MQVPARHPVQAGPRRGDHQNRRVGQDEHDIADQQIAVAEGEIERRHQTVKTRGLLENRYLPGDLENQIGTFADDYNDQRYHDGLNNFTLVD